MQLLNEATVRLSAAGAVAGTSAVNGAAVDTANGIDVTFVATIATANAGNKLKVQQDSDSAFGTAEDLAGAEAVALVNGDVVAVGVYRPTKRYVRGVIVRGASTATGDMYCVQEGARVLPVDNNVASEIVSAVVVSPAAA